MEQETQPTKRRKLSPSVHATKWMAELINDEDYADVEFLVGDDNILDNKDEEMEHGQRKFLANRVVLAKRSPVFKRMLYGQMKESCDKSTVITINDIQPDAFANLLHFIYTDSEDLNETNLLPTLYCAKKYQVKELERCCYEWIHKIMRPGMALAMIQRATKFHLVDDISDICLKKALKSGKEILESKEWLDLSLDNVKAFIASDEFIAPNESQVFEACVSWAAYQCKKDGKAAKRNNMKERLYPLIPHIRFELMSLSELRESVLIHRYLTDDRVLNIVYQRGQYQSPRPRGCTLLTYSHDLDTNGLVYYLGTAYRKMSQFVNPALPDNDSHFAMSILLDGAKRGNAYSITSRKNKAVYTHCRNNNKLVLELPEDSELRPTHYTLAYSEHLFDTGGPLHSWVLEGFSSRDAKWEVLVKHHKDKSLDKDVPFATHTWEIVSDEWFTSFRVRQTGPNRKGSLSMAISGIEFYGLFKYSPAAGTFNMDVGDN